MKNLLLSISIIFSMSMLFSSCDKNEDDFISNNYLKIDNSTYDLSSGILDYFASEIEDENCVSYCATLGLYTDGFITDDAIATDDVYGKGHLIIFSMTTSSSEKLVDGTYTFSELIPSPTMTFDEGFYLINYELSENQDIDEAESGGVVKDGKILVSKTDDEYTIEIDCVGENGETITGYYEGKLRYVVE
jgi:hypothetical protein